MPASRRSRRSMPKVRTGCAICKSRRVKCDEERPSCRRCVSTGRDCPGYTEELRPSVAIKIYKIPFKAPGSRQDRELLHFFCCETAGCLSRFSDTTLWTHLILQRSQHQPVIRNALVTLSSLHRDYLRVGSALLEVSSKNIKLILRSHKQLLHLLGRDASPEAALICSLIFYIFECLIGNTQLAIWHLDQGLKLLRQCCMDQTLDAGSDTTSAQLVAVFTRLDIHASIFSYERIPILELTSTKQVSGLASVVPEQFSSLTDAEETLVVLQNWTMRHLVLYVEYKLKPLDEVPANILHERLQLEIEFRRLEDGIANVGSDPHKETFTVSDVQRKLLLQSQTSTFHGALLETFLLPFSQSDTSVQAYYKFELALNQISSLLSLSNTSKNSAASNRDFTLSTNIIAMLYFICMKTRSCRILHMALSLMQDSLSSARDGLWDARKAAVVIQAMLSDGDKDSDDPEIVAKLEDVGSGILDASSGLDEVFQMLRISESLDSKDPLKK
ncbi:hypothetical protein N7474_001335 [Penicillium riverlandense]|uniref:uncharacterized protein n=1 Tax=Penicillium riverlandense TaxID=1903569 RepID=UPI0025487013|nr:uncharacterized protein N7474_001335 [Penicillium riverlandense]KAJ5833024.1 hypothetical protein N7474_001335 [Penicillium riverlandense]